MKTIYPQSRRYTGEPGSKSTLGLQLGRQLLERDIRENPDAAIVYTDLEMTPRQAEHFAASLLALRHPKGKR